MLHGTVVKGYAKAAYRAKPCHAKRCGHATTYVTKVPDWCEACRPAAMPREYYRRYAYTRQGKPIQPPAYVSAPVVAPPGFCRVCGVIRLSKADVGNTCEGCRTDKL